MNKMIKRRQRTLRCHATTKAINLFAIIFLISDLEIVVKSDDNNDSVTTVGRQEAAVGWPNERASGEIVTQSKLPLGAELSLSVSTSVDSSNNVEPPPVGQTFERHQQKQVGNLPADQQTISTQTQAMMNHPVGKILDRSLLSPMPVAVAAQHLEQKKARTSISEERLKRGNNLYQLLRPQTTLTLRDKHESSLSGRSMDNLPNTTMTSRYSSHDRTNHNRLKSLSKAILTGAKNVLTGSFASIEQRAGSIFSLGSNLLALLIPVASLLGLPNFSAANEETSNANDTKGTSTLTNRLLATISSLTNSQQLISALANGQTSGPASGLHGRVDYVMGWLERSIEHLPSFPRLHPQECVKRSICEAHNEPEKYGALGLTLRLLFPANHSNETEIDNMDYKVINKYRHAAGYGLNKRLDNNNFNQPVCKDKYEDCLVSLLGIGQNMLDFFLR